MYHFCKDLSGKAQKSIAHLEEELLNQHVAATDATVVTVNGKQSYIRNFSMERAVVYRAMKDKTLSAMRKLDFLRKYTGILVHDHETALYHFGTGHGECNVYIIRYLRKNSEDTGNGWSGEMIKLLDRMEKYMGNHLLFVHDFEVPFDDNMSGRDLRKAKNRQKMAGGFRKESGHESLLFKGWLNSYNLQSAPLL